MSLFVAILTASLAATFNFPYRSYRCWASWGRGRVIKSVVLAYFLIAGVGGGFLGWLVASLANARPHEDAIVRGILYGAAGAIALRVDFKEAGRQDVNADQRNARSLLDYGIKWTRAALEAEARQQAIQTFAKLKDLDLIKSAVWVHAGLRDDSEVGLHTKNVNREALLTAIAALSEVIASEVEGKTSQCKEEARPGASQAKEEARADIALPCAKYCVSGGLTRAEVAMES